MPTLVADHHVKDFDAWLEIFNANPPPELGSWRVIRGIDDPTRVQVVSELDASEVAGIKEFIASEKMQAVFRQVNQMSTQPMEIIWLDEVRLGVPG